MNKEQAIQAAFHLLQEDKKTKINDISAYMRSVDDVESAYSSSVIDADRAEEQLVEVLAQILAAVDRLQAKKSLLARASRVVTMVLAFAFVFSMASCSQANYSYRKLYAPYSKEKKRLANHKRADFCKPKTHKIRL